MPGHDVYDRRQLLGLLMAGLLGALAAQLWSLHSQQQLLQATTRLAASWLAAQPLDAERSYRLIGATEAEATGWRLVDARGELLMDNALAPSGYALTAEAEIRHDAVLVGTLRAAQQGRLAPSALIGGAAGGIALALLGALAARRRRAATPEPAQDTITLDASGRVTALGSVASEALGVESTDLQGQSLRPMLRQAVAESEVRDAVTGALGRAAFEALLRRALGDDDTETLAHRTLCLVDLDRFHIVNDLSGHAAGDALLAQLGAALAGELREGEALGRLGGDEFALLLRDAPEQLSTRCQALLTRLRDHRFEWKGREFRVTGSLGAVGLDAAAQSVSQLLTLADAACRTAKDSGRDRAYIHAPGDRLLELRHAEMDWANRVAAAVDEDRLCLFRQAIQALTPQADHGDHFEVLLRMVDRDGRIIGPGAWVPAAERYGLMPAIDRWTISAAIKAVAEADTHPGRRIDTCGINLSGASLGDPSLVDFVVECARTHGVDPERICLEVTETAAIENIASAQGLLQRLRDAGFQLALDDFGSGLSSFAYLRALPVDYLKIDGAFVKHMVIDPMDCSIVESMNAIGHARGLRTIAEYVEDEATADLLRYIGVDFGQGYGIEKPRPLYLPESLRRRFPELAQGLV